MNEQELLDQFEKDMIELALCTNYNKERNGCVTIRCKFDRWFVNGQPDMELTNKAMQHFEQHKKDGLYDDLLNAHALHSRES